MVIEIDSIDYEKQKIYSQKVVPVRVCEFKSRRAHKKDFKKLKSFFLYYKSHNLQY